MIDPIVQRAYDAATAILGEAGHVNGALLLCEVDDGGVILAWDDDAIPPDLLAATLRRAADRIDADEPDNAGAPT